MGMDRLSSFQKSEEFSVAFHQCIVERFSNKRIRQISAL